MKLNDFTVVLLSFVQSQTNNTKIQAGITMSSMTNLQINIKQEEDNAREFHRLSGPTGKRDPVPSLTYV